MENLKHSDRETQLLLDVIGAEPLISSGFENEESEPDFDTADNAGREE